jgi:hypothetical protein
MRRVRTSSRLDLIVRTNSTATPRARPVREGIVGSGPTRTARRSTSFLRDFMAVAAGVVQRGDAVFVV